MTSPLEETFLLMALADGFPMPDREVLLVPGRRWRADFAWPDRKLCIEMEGGIWTNGRHTRGGGYRMDCQKYNEAMLNGWRMLRFTGEDLSSGYAMPTLRRAWDG